MYAHTNIDSAIFFSFFKNARFFAEKNISQKQQKKF